ncbi:MAG TPA: Ig-like domain-containing protein [bacterium]|nr:Ig-like domain-containing protein [bacterium]
MTGYHNHFKLIALLLCLPFLFLSSCGDDDDDDDSGNAADDDTDDDDNDTDDDDTNDDDTDDDDTDDDDTDDDDIDDDDTNDDDTGDDDTSEPPTVVDISPEMSEDEIPLGSPVVITFSEAMDKTAVEGAFQMADSSTVITGTFSWKADDTIMTFQPTDPMAEYRTYSVSLTGAQTLDATGQPMAEDYWIEFDSVDLWTREYAGAGTNNEIGYGVDIDDAGNVYACGYEATAAQGDDAWMRKITKNGFEAWKVTYNGPGNDIDWYTGCAYDPAGYVIGAGRMKPADKSTYDILVGKYHASDGTPEWIKTLSPSATHDLAYNVAVDADSNIYLTGKYVEQDPTTDWIWVGKYDEDLNEIWTDSYAASSNDDSHGNSIAVNESGVVAAVGTYFATSTNPNVWLRVYDADGTVLWTEIRDGGENGYDLGEGVQIDAEGNVYVTGRQNDYDLFVRKYDDAGDLVWEVVQEDDYWGRSITLDTEGNVWLAAEKYVDGENWNILIEKFDGDGNYLWENSLNGTLNNFDGTRGIATNAKNIGVLTGFIRHTSTGADVWVRKYDPDGGWSN